MIHKTQGEVFLSIKLQDDVVDGTAVEGLGIGECEGESSLLRCGDAFHDDEVLVVFVCHLQRIAGGKAARHAPVFFLCFLAGRVGVGKADDVGLSVNKMDGEHLPQFVVVEHEAAGLLHEVHPAGTSADGVEMGNLVFAQLANYGCAVVAHAYTKELASVLRGLRTACSARCKDEGEQQEQSDGNVAYDLHSSAKVRNN